MSRSLNFQRSIAIAIIAVTFGFCMVAIGSVDQQHAQLAATTRLHQIQFNACDQYGQDAVGECKSNNPSLRANAIIETLTDFNADIATFQEICYTTANLAFNGMNAQNNGTWDFRLLNTYPVSDNRCGTVDRRWGLAIFTRGSSFVNPGTYPLPDDPNDPNPNPGHNYMFCASTTVGVGFRLCSAHPRSDSNPPLTRQQVSEIARQLNVPVSQGAAVVLGADLNLNNRFCPTEAGALALGVLYRNAYGPPTQCSTNRGNFYEADEPLPNGDGTYNEPTAFGAPYDRKLDYAFFNYQKFYTDFGGDATSSNVSDHDPLRAAMTVHP